MNVPILILPALAATLALSAAKTLPADLRHDAQGKTPLTVAKMAVARGSGSVCRWGCTSDQDQPCHPVYEPLCWDGNCTSIIVRYEAQLWNPHLECGFDWGTDSCTPLGEEDECNTVYTFGDSDSNCSQPPTKVDVTTTSTCAIPVPPGGPGN